MESHAGIFAPLEGDLGVAKAGLAQSIANRIRAAVVRGELVAGDRIPASRTIAAELGIARGTVTTAIETLVAEGVLEAKVGSGVFVAEAAVALHQADADESPDQPPPFAMPVRPDVDTGIGCRIDFRPCRPSLEAFPLQTWKRCVADAGSEKPSSDYGSPLGDERLRTTICEYLRRARGLVVSPAQMIITNGAVHAMHLVAQLYLDARCEVVVEDPGYPLARQVFAKTGANVLPIAVDNDGLRVDLLPENPGSVRIVCVTPSHQFPTGARLSLLRRKALLEWARRSDALIIEDDYDGEFRYDVPPLSPLAALGGNRVLYIGTFSKTMFPGLRVGFAVGSEHLVEAMGRLRTLSEYAPSLLAQSALRRFVEGGHYERHILRMRRIYRDKRGELVRSLRENIPDLIVSGIDSGLNANVQLPEGTSSQIASDYLAKMGVVVPTLGRYTLDQSHDQEGLVVGFAAPAKRQIAEFGKLLAGSLQTIQDAGSVGTRHSLARS